MSESALQTRLRCLAWAVLASVVAAGGACAPSARELPPYGEALIVVDTDVPVPQQVNRLRFDLYSADGAKWHASRDVALRDPRDWPTSLSVYTPDTTREHVALVRLRAYAEGRIRDYRGERFVPRELVGAPGDKAVTAVDCAVPSECELPRLSEGGVDTTPRTEPMPSFAVDRLLRVRLVPGARGRVYVVLKGICTGTMADLAGGRSCIDKDSTISAADPMSVEASMTVPPPVTRDFGAPVPCPASASPRPGRTRDGQRMLDEEVCVPGGTFTFGATSPFDVTYARLATVAPFYIDKYEVTVARWRELGAMSTAAPRANASKLERETCASQPESDNRWCSFSAAPRVPEDRENYALTCVTWEAARAFCQSLGGDLPTDVQWEWAANYAGRAQRTYFSWGDEGATCEDSAGHVDRAVFFRLSNCGLRDNYYDTCVPGAGGKYCGTGRDKITFCDTRSAINPRQGPQPVDAVDRPTGDLSSLGIVNLTGGVSEYALDAFHALDSNCWAAAPLVAPTCVDSSAKRTIRGLHWASAGYDTGRRPTSGTAPTIGFRCARPMESK